jgi:ABC-2 type transport system permease protein
VEAKKHLRIYLKYFIQYWKTRLIYKKDFLLGFFSQAINLAVSVAFIGLIFTQVENLQGWSFDEMLLLVGFSGLIMNLHHIFLFNIYNLGEDYIIKGRFDRFLVRPLNPLFQIYADSVSDNNLSKLIANIAIIFYAAGNIEANLLTLPNVGYGFLAVLSGVMVFASMYLWFATTAFWTGRSQSAIWLIFRLSDFRKYPYSIFGRGVQLILITIVPLAFASFFPVTFFLSKGDWAMWQYLSLIIGPIFFTTAYSFWRYGVSSYSSTGS